MCPTVGVRCALEMYLSLNSQGLGVRIPFQVRWEFRF